jgi:Lysozyme like domain
MTNVPAQDVGAIVPFRTSGGDGSTDGTTPSPGNAEPAPMPPVSSGSPPTNQGLTALSFAQVENFWMQAGGSPQAAAMAAAVADAESGLNAAATRTNPDGTVGIGLWLVPQNGTPPGSTDPLANARAAVQLSQNGQDWSQWCSTWSDNNCGENNGTYLGSGSNALMSLGTQKAGASYNVFGSAPAGSGVGASTATSGLGGNSTTTSSKSKYLAFAVIILIIVGIWFFSRRKKTEQE